jgi:hypothetical protein
MTEVDRARSASGTASTPRSRDWTLKVRKSSDRVTVEFDYLAELTGRSTPEMQVEWSDEVHIDRVSIEYESPRDVVAVMAGETVRVSSQWSTGGSGVIGRSEISETVVLSVDTREPLSLQVILGRYVSRLRDLITLRVSVMLVPR